MARPRRGPEPAAKEMVTVPGTAPVLSKYVVSRLPLVLKRATSQAEELVVPAATSLPSGCNPRAPNHPPRAQGEGRGAAGAEGGVHGAVGVEAGQLVVAVHDDL